MPLSREVHQILRKSPRPSSGGAVADRVTDERAFRVPLEERAARQGYDDPHASTRCKDGASRGGIRFARAVRLELWLRRSKTTPSSATPTRRRSSAGTVRSTGSACRDSIV